MKLSNEQKRAVLKISRRVILMEKGYGAEWAVSDGKLRELSLYQVITENGLVLARFNGPGFAEPGRDEENRRTER